MYFTAQNAMGVRVVVVVVVVVVGDDSFQSQGAPTCTQAREAK
jgi:hypothetical protein